jgi:hypothetical protein
LRRKSVLILCLVLCFAVAFAIVNASNVEVIQVDALTEKTLTFNLNSGQKFTGSLAVSGGSGNDIDFWVTDPQGTKIVDSGRVSQGKTFQFTAQASGAYALHFSNGFSLLSSKTVNLTYDIGLPSVFGFDIGQLLIIIGVVVILLIVIVALAVALHRRKRTVETNQPPSNSPQQPMP